MTTVRGARRLFRIAATMLTVMSASLALSACDPGHAHHTPTSSTTTPTPTPTTASTPSAADIEAAKEAYLNYVAAIADFDPRDASTLDGILSLTTGEQTTVDKTYFRSFIEQGWSIDGASSITLMSEDGNASGPSRVTLLTCSDVSNVRIIDADGVERKADGQLDIQPIRVSVDRVADHWLVAKLEPRTGDPAC